MLTTDIFCWVSGIIIAILLCLLLPILVQILGLRSELKPISSLVHEVDTFLKARGLEKYTEGLKGNSNKNHHSLTPEKMMERDRLIEIANQYGLTEPDAIRLQQLLEEDARDDFKRGLINALALAAILLAVGAIINSLSKA